MKAVNGGDEHLDILCSSWSRIKWLKCIQIDAYSSHHNRPETTSQNTVSATTLHVESHSPRTKVLDTKTLTEDRPRIRFQHPARLTRFIQYVTTR
jgi:hypothetical protein